MAAPMALIGAFAVAGAPAGCGSGSTNVSNAAHTAKAGPSGTASPGMTSPSAAAAGTATAAASMTVFVPIVEPFDPGHPARAKSAPASCDGQQTTIAIEQCYETRTENTDAAINAVQSARYRAGTAPERAAILASDKAWLAARPVVCGKAFHSGGTIDGINISACLLDESTARLASVKGITPPVAKLNSTDSTDPSALSWYTTPAGSRIAMVDTQGDSSGGSVISWVIIGGAQGFVVNPGQFSYQDGSFTDHGKTEPPNPTGHRVATGTEYQFGIDYTRLSADPHAGKGTGGYVYAAGVPVAIWR
ncbi:MAG TPA: lysozyme inhibitor LprI family protein [Streptosporangiaceae bacterium]